MVETEANIRAELARLLENYEREWANENYPRALVLHARAGELKWVLGEH